MRTFFINLAAWGLILGLISCSTPDVMPGQDRPYPGNSQGQSYDNLSIINPGNLEPQNGDPNSEYFCTTTRYKYSPLTDRLWVYSGLPELLLGHLYDSESVAQGNPQKLIYEPSRRQLTVTFGGGPVLDGKSTYYIGDRKKTTDAINKLKTTPILTANPASFKLKIDSVTSLQHLALSFYGSVDVLGELNFATEFSFSDTSTTTKVVARFDQKFYSLDLGGVENENSFFAKELPKNHPNFDLGYEPVYLSSITYGRIINLAIESNASFSQINAAMSAAAKIKSATAQAEFELEYGNLFRSSTMQIEVFGGNAGESLKLNNGVPDFYGMIEGKLAYDPIRNPGTPINYVFSGLYDNQQYSFRNEADFTTTVCRDLVDGYDLTLDRIECLDCHGKADIYGLILATDSRGETQDSLFFAVKDEAQRIKDGEPLNTNGQTRIRFFEPNPSADYFEAKIELMEARVQPFPDRTLPTQIVRWQIDNILQADSTIVEVPWANSSQKLKLKFTVTPTE